MLKLMSLTTGSVLSRYYHVNVKFLISIMVKLLL